MNLTSSEQQIIEQLRTLKPYEEIKIVADKQGKPDTYFITRTTKALLIVGTLDFVK